MDSKRLIKLRELIGYDNPGIAKMFNIDVTEVDAYCLGTKDVPDKIALDLEAFADWSCEVSHTETKRELAKIHLNKPE
ncbi:MAG: hypothetical protein EG822_02610 [Deltaproteobacteria bacterium]|nr:hypothetical protein [Deltaproteobacteria bacterium]TLN02004.1 MAG: hypothetical protein FDZ73_13595 [bacterium]